MKFWDAAILQRGEQGEFRCLFRKDHPNQHWGAPLLALKKQRGSRLAAQGSIIPAAGSSYLFQGPSFYPSCSLLLLSMTMLMLSASHLKTSTNALHAHTDPASHQTGWCQVSSLQTGSRRVKGLEQGRAVHERQSQGWKLWSPQT